MSAMAFAAPTTDTDFSDGIYGEFNATDKDDSAVVDTDKTIEIKKELTAYNPDASTVHAPVITYTYEIAAGSANKNITDNKNYHESATSSHVLTKAGLIEGLKVTGATNGTSNSTPTVAAAAATSVSDSIVWNNTGTLNTAADGAANISELKLDFSGVAFNAAGVYRYVITETTSAYETNGVVDGNADSSLTNVRYLDVYVKDGSTAGTYDVYGYVCFKSDNDIDANDTTSAAPAVVAAEKSSGFVDTDTSSADASNADKYYTFDVQIKKDLVGDQAMNGHQFPFKVTFTNTKLTATTLLIAEGTSGKTTIPTPTSAVIGSTVYDGKDGAATAQIKIADEGEVKLVGIPAGTLVTIAEYNDAVGTTYKVKTEKGTTNIDPAVALAWNNWSSNITALGGTANTNAKVSTNFTATGSNEILFTNTLELISPTGVVLRVAPYIAILCGGIVLLVLTKKRKADEEA